MAVKKNDIKEPAFEEAMARLEEIVRALEDGKAPLDTSLSLFEEGVKLVTSCKKQLDCAEQKVKMLSENGEDDGKDLEDPQ